MNRMDLVDEMVEVLGSRKVAEDAYVCIVETIKRALKRKEPISLAGFGTFKVGERAICAPWVVPWAMAC